MTRGGPRRLEAVNLTGPFSHWGGAGGENTEFPWQHRILIKEISSEINARLLADLTFIYWDVLGLIFFFCPFPPLEMVI